MQHKKTVFIKGEKGSSKYLRSLLTLLMSSYTPTASAGKLCADDCLCDMHIFQALRNHSSPGAFLSPVVGDPSEFARPFSICEKSLDISAFAWDCSLGEYILLILWTSGCPRTVNIHWISPNVAKSRVWPLVSYSKHMSHKLLKLWWRRENSCNSSIVELQMGLSLANLLLLSNSLSYMSRLGIFFLYLPVWLIWWDRVSEA